VGVGRRRLLKGGGDEWGRRRGWRGYLVSGDWGGGGEIEWLMNEKCFLKESKQIISSMRTSYSY